jgi:hypothetical protein
MPRAGKKKAQVEENDGLKVNVRPLGEFGAWARPRACGGREGSPLPVGMGITRREVDTLETVRFGKSRNAEVVKGPTVWSVGWLGPLAISRFLTEFGIAGGEFV